MFQGALKFSSESSGSSRLFQRAVVQSVVLSWPGELYRNIYASLPSTYAEIQQTLAFYVLISVLESAFWGLHCRPCHLFLMLALLTEC